MNLMNSPAWRMLKNGRMLLPCGKFGRKRMVMPVRFQPSHCCFMFSNDVSGIGIHIIRPVQGQNSPMMFWLNLTSPSGAGNVCQYMKVVILMSGLRCTARS